MPLTATELLSFTTNLATLYASYPPTPEAFATSFAALYKTYAMNAVSCAPSPPTVVFDTKLKDRIVEGLSIGSYAGCAEKWALGFKEFWENGKFGPSGDVTDTGDTTTLKDALAALWEAQSKTMTQFPIAAQAHGPIIETYTKSVKVKDTALPQPPGCGPSNIS